MVAPQLHNVDIEDMAPNSGATVQKGLCKVAVYKDEEGKKHAFSALCPHLGCLLQVSVGGLPLNILPFAFWAAFYNSVVMPCVMTSALCPCLTCLLQDRSVVICVVHFLGLLCIAVVTCHSWLVLPVKPQGLVKLQGLVKPHRQALLVGSLFTSCRPSRSLVF